MEERLRAIEIAQAVQQEKIDTLTASVVRLTTTIEELTAALNKTKGGWVVVLSVAALVGFIINFIQGFFNRV